MPQAITGTAFRCGRCAAGLDAEQFADATWKECPYCNTPTQIARFAAYYAPLRQADFGERVLESSEASCFYHPQKRAVIPCDSCGLYLCGLCRVEWGAESYCPACIESGQRQKTIPNLENYRTQYDSMALALATFPALGIYPIVITAPLSLFLVFRHWNKSQSLLPRTKLRFVFATLFSLLGLLLIAALVAAVVFAIRQRSSTR